MPSLPLSLASFTKVDLPLIALFLHVVPGVKAARVPSRRVIGRIGFVCVSGKEIVFSNHYRKHSQSQF